MFNLCCYWTFGNRSVENSLGLQYRKFDLLLIDAATVLYLTKDFFALFDFQKLNIEYCTNISHNDF